MSDESRPRGDKSSTKSRILAAAITLFADQGVAATGVRAIAAAADVHPSLIIHYFGTKDGLRVACDKHVAAFVREHKQQVMRSAGRFDPAALRDLQDGPPLLRYLARTLADGSPHTAALVDEMVNDAVGYLAEGVASGLVRETDYPYERAALLAIWSLGALALHEHVQRLLGVDLTNLDGVAAMESTYGRAASELLGNGIYRT
ncbi:TetR family transcriptional regulator [Salinispora cortesiana]|uniref:TetR family transcriptional regulator n=1 Tax=Salinispora cortesiana TaxID=1305843 RepID=UPI0004197707|nr:TetR family transcriptional regulator [Salinispora cortesiana]